MDEVSAAQAAMLTGLSERTIRRKIAAGELPARRIAPNRFGIAVGDLPRRRDINDLVRRLAELEQRVMLLEERQYVLARQPTHDTAAPSDTGEASAALASNEETDATLDILNRLLIQLANEVERFAPLLTPPASDEERGKRDARRRVSSVWPRPLADDTAQ